MRLADVIDTLAENKQELEALVQRVDKIFKINKIDISVEDKEHQWHPE